MTICHVTILFLFFRDREKMKKRNKAFLDDEAEEEVEGEAEPVEQQGGAVKG